MNQDTPLMRSLRKAVEANPDDVPLRLHLAELLMEAGRDDEAIPHIAAALQRVPNSAQARALMARAVSHQRNKPKPQQNPKPNPPGQQSGYGRPLPPVPAAPRRRGIDEPTERHSFNWAAAEGQFVGIPQPFVDSGTAPLGEPIRFDVELPKRRLADVTGMAEVKRRLDQLFIAPLRGATTDVRRGRLTHPSVLLYGPPGCGKTYLARAAAGELGARFLRISLADSPEIWVGPPERNLREIFAEARRAKPCVLFLDDIDALGPKKQRAQSSGNPLGLVNTLLSELDGASRDPDGPFVLAAASSPWEIDPVLRRPGRLDRLVLVTPPDQPAREAILHQLLREKRVGAVNLRELAKRTDEYSAAELAQICELAAERAQADTGRGAARLIGTRDFDAALAEVRAELGSWLTAARNATQFAAADAGYEDLALYLKRRRMA